MVNDNADTELSKLLKSNAEQVLRAAPQIDNIELLELLGTGGMSLVYKARQTQLDRVVAVKVLSGLIASGEEGIKRFHNEAKLTSMLVHPNIVRTISFGISKNEQPYLVMEYLDGFSLAAELKQHGRFKLKMFRNIFLSALSALDYSHQAGLIHRDIKPGNIMICRSETDIPTVKLVDFGIAKVLAEEAFGDKELTESGVLLGSPAYMSPEQCQGKILDRRSDLYSLACVMYETLAGEPPFSGDSLLEVMQKHIHEPPPTVAEFKRRVDIDQKLAEVIIKGLSKNIDERPRTASEFAVKLSEGLEGNTLDKVPMLESTSPNYSRLVRGGLFLALAILCLLGIIRQVKDKHNLEIERLQRSIINHSAKPNDAGNANQLLREVELHLSDGESPSTKLMKDDLEKITQLIPKLKQRSRLLISNFLRGRIQSALHDDGAAFQSFESAANYARIEEKENLVTAACYTQEAEALLKTEKPNARENLQKAQNLANKAIHVYEIGESTPDLPTELPEDLYGQLDIIPAYREAVAYSVLSEITKRGLPELSSSAAKERELEYLIKARDVVRDAEGSLGSCGQTFKLGEFCLESGFRDRALMEISRLKSETQAQMEKMEIGKIDFSGTRSITMEPMAKSLIWSWNYLGLLYKKAGMTQEAVESFEKGVDCARACHLEADSISLKTRIELESIKRNK